MQAFAPELPDPRQKPQALESNRLIHTAESVLRAASADDAALWREDLCAQIGALAERADMLMLSVALAMAPSQAVYRTLWQALCEVTSRAPGRHVLVFALPVVLVAGAAGKAALPAALADEAGLNALLREHGVFTPGAEAFVSGALVHPDDLSALSAPVLYKTAREAATALSALPGLAGRGIEIDRDGVFLRYLVGAAVQEEGRPAPVRLGGEVGSWGLPMMKFLGGQLKAEGVTLFPIARPPLPVLPAMVEGGKVRQSVALQVFASSQIRRLRDAQARPVAVLAAHEGGEIRLTIASEGGEGAHEGFVWSLSPLDAVAEVERMACELLAECQVDDVRVVPAVQPATLADGRAFLAPADVTPAARLH